MVNRANPEPSSIPTRLRLAVPVGLMTSSPARERFGPGRSKKVLRKQVAAVTKVEYDNSRESLLNCFRSARHPLTRSCDVPWPK